MKTKLLFFLSALLGMGGSLSAQTNSARMLSGVNYIPCASGSYTIQAADVTMLDDFTSTCSVTIPAANTSGFGAGTIFSVKNDGPGTVVITPASGSINQAASLTLTTKQGGDIYSDGQNYGVQQGAGTGGGGSIGGGVVNNILTATSASASSFLPVGIPLGNGGSAVSTCPYTVKPDTSITTVDRGTVIELNSASACAVTLDDPGISGMANNFAIKFRNVGAGTVTVSRQTSATFSIVNGSTFTGSATSFTLTTGQFATVYTDNTNWRVDELILNPLNGVFCTGGSIYATVQSTITAAGTNGVTCVPATYAGTDSPSGTRIVNINVPTLSTQPGGAHVMDYRFGSYADSLFNPGFDGQSTNWAARQTITNWNQNIGTQAAGGINAISHFFQANYLSGTQNLNQNGYTNKTNLTAIFSVLNTWYPSQVNADQWQANCYGDGDCIGGTGNVVSFGGTQAGSDEGIHSMSYSASQGYVEYKGTCSSGCTTGSTSITIAPTVAASIGTQGVRIGALYDQTTGVINAGTITSITGSSGLDTVTGSGTGWPVSTQTTSSTAVTIPAFTTTTQAITVTGSQTITVTSSTGLGVGATVGIGDVTANNYEAVVLTAVAVGSITANFTKTHLTNSVVSAQTPGIQNVTVGSSTGFTTSSIVCAFDVAGPIEYVKPNAIPDGTHITANFLYSHPTGTSFATGGLCGYGFSLPADTWNTGGAIGYTNVTAPLRQIWPIAYSSSATSATIWISIASLGDAYAGNATFPGASYNIYQMAEVISVTNGGSTFSNTLTLMPNIVAWTANDVVSQALSPTQKFSVSNAQLTKFFPSQGVASGGWSTAYNGIWNGNDTFFGMSNNTANTLYSGHSGNLAVPLAFLAFYGLTRYGLNMQDAPDSALIAEGCPINSSGTQSCVTSAGTSMIIVNAANNGGSDTIQHFPNPGISEHHGVLATNPPTRWASRRFKARPQLAREGLMKRGGIPARKRIARAV